MGWVHLDNGQAGQVRTDKKDIFCCTGQTRHPTIGVSMSKDEGYSTTFNIFYLLKPPNGSSNRFAKEP